MLSPKQKGMISEAAVMKRFLELGFMVALPIGDNERYDLLVDRRMGKGFERVQVKTARLQGSGCIVFNSCRSTHKTGKRTFYGIHELDLFASYYPKTGEVFLVPRSEVLGALVYLRLDPSGNNQTKGIKWACDYLI